MLSAVFAAAIALIVLAQSADPDSTDEIVVAYRGANTSRYAEGTLPAYQYAVRNRADLLDGDVRWTKDGPDRLVGTMIILHDAALDRITNCRGTVSSWLWSSISAQCRTDVGGQEAHAFGRPAQAWQLAGSRSLWSSRSPDHRRPGQGSSGTPSELQGSARSYVRPACPTEQDQEVHDADPRHRTGLCAGRSGTGGWPSVSAIRATGAAVHARLEVPVSVAKATGKPTSRCSCIPGGMRPTAKIVARNPYGWSSRTCPDSSVGATAPLGPRSSAYMRPRWEGGFYDRAAHDDDFRSSWVGRECVQSLAVVIKEKWWLMIPSVRTRPVRRAAIAAAKEVISAYEPLIVISGGRASKG